MATATIPELIQPGTLYTPDDTALSIASGWCPNTDDALEIDGAAANFRAYQPAISGIHYPAVVGDPFSLCYWANQDTGFNTGNSNNSSPASRQIASVMDIAPAVATTITQSTSTTGWRWSLSNHTTSGTTRAPNFFMAVGAASSLYIAASGGTNFPSGTAPYQIAVLIDGSTRLVYKNGVNNVSLFGGAGTPGTPGALSAPFFAIGAYSTAAGWSFPAAGITYLAKFSIWNRLLTTTELSDLYDSMTLGPPSP